MLKKISQHGARKRQLRYLAGLLRDADTQVIEHVILDLQNQNRQQANQLHYIEQCRDSLLENGDTVLSELMNKHPSLDASYIRQLLRKPDTANQRKLFRYLRDALLPESGAGTTDSEPVNT